MRRPLPGHQPRCDGRAVGGVCGEREGEAIKLAMPNLLRESTPVAKKPYGCDASEYVLDSDMLADRLFSISELRQIVMARRNQYMIRPGQMYIKQVSVDETAREMYVFRAIPAMHNLCIRYDLYPEW